MSANGKTLAESGALRQLKHNDGSEGFVFAYDKDATDQYIAELRAALAGDEPEHGEPFMYKLPGDYDWHIGFAPLPEGAFRIKALAAAPLPQQAAGDERVTKTLKGLNFLIK